MKAVTAVCPTGTTVPPISSGRIHRSRGSENAEIQMYLTKLQDLVPFMPKNRKMSKLEVIQHVIDYICELQNALENHPSAGAFDAAAVLGPPAAAAPAAPPRRPLTPANCLLPAAPAPPAPPAPHSPHHTHTTPERTSEDDSPLSC